MTQFKPSFTTEGDNRSPLIKFSGTLKEYIGEEREGRNNSYMIVKFNFTDVQVIESSEPYPFPIATIEIPYNKREGTRWAVFAGSAKKAINVDDIDLMVGKRQTWHYGPCKLRGPLYNEDGTPKLNARNQAEWGDSPGEAWQVTSVEGFGSASNGTGDLTAKLIDLAVGKTDSDFYSALFTSSDLKKLPGFSDAVEAAQERKLLDTLAASGAITKTLEGTWAKV